MHRVHVDPARLAQDHIVLTDEDYHYLCRVLRLVAGDSLVLFDGEGGEADAEVSRVGPRAAELRVHDRRRAAPRTGPDVVLIQGLIKGDRLDLVVQKATELGVTRILPVSTTRAVERLELDRASARRLRWEKIAREAARQCGRADVPEIAPPAPLAIALAAADGDALKLILWEEARNQSLKASLPSQAPRSIVIAVGPEGGFTVEEVAGARRAGFTVVGLGPRILRAETAALASLAMLGFAFGDLGG